MLQPNGRTKLYSVYACMYIDTRSANTCNVIKALHQPTTNISHVRYKGFSCQKSHFSFVKKCKFCQKFCHKSRISSVFRHPKLRLFQQCITVTAVNLFYEVLPKQFGAFGFYFSQEKNRWLLNTGYPEQLLFLLGITLWVGRSLIIIF